MYDLTVFYAWQSDLPSKLNRYLIRDAARSALGHLATAFAFEEAPRLDSDTQNRSGTPQIAGTIFDKIDQCGVFLADLTFVGRSEAQDEQQARCLPNPNVLLELGYAAARIGWERIICVMNKSNGNPEDLPFDLRHRRWPICYDLPIPNKDQIKSERERLSTKLEFAIRSTLQAEHSRVQDVIARLDANCLCWMHDFGNQDGFMVPARRTMGQVVANQGADNALLRLLDLRILRCVSHASLKGEGRYRWTYLGKLALAQLGYATPKNG